MNLFCGDLCKQVVAARLLALDGAIQKSGKICSLFVVAGLNREDLPASLRPSCSQASHIEGVAPCGQAMSIAIAFRLVIQARSPQRASLPHAAGPALAAGRRQGPAEKLEVKTARLEVRQDR